VTGAVAGKARVTGEDNLAVYLLLPYVWILAVWFLASILCVDLMIKTRPSDLIYMRSDGDNVLACVLGWCSAPLDRPFGPVDLGPLIRVLWLRSSLLTLRLILRPHRIFFLLTTFLWLTGLGLGPGVADPAFCTPIFLLFFLIHAPPQNDLFIFFF
jgi:hypothetical protein